MLAISPFFYFLFCFVFFVQSKLCALGFYWRIDLTTGALCNAIQLNFRVYMHELLMNKKNLSQSVCSMYSLFCKLSIVSCCVRHTRMSESGLKFSWCWPPKCVLSKHCCFGMYQKWPRRAAKRPSCIFLHITLSTQFTTGAIAMA